MRCKADIRTTDACGDERRSANLSAMIKIHHAQRTRGARVIWLLEELGEIPYEIVPVAFKPEVLQDPEFLKLHPLGQLPVVEIDGLFMFESGAIVEFLLERYGHGRLAPAPGSDARAGYLQWFHYGEASLAAHVSALVRLRFGNGGVPPEETWLSFTRERVYRAAKVVDDCLATRPYICGEDFTAADLMISYGLVMARVIRELPADLTHVARYLERLKARPAYAKAWA
jgi:glutathione S-transferase